MIIQATYHDQPIISSTCDRWFGMLSLELVITRLHVALKKVSINNSQQFLRQQEVALTGRATLFTNCNVTIEVEVLLFIKKTAANIHQLADFESGGRALEVLGNGTVRCAGDADADDVLGEEEEANRGIKSTEPPWTCSSQFQSLDTRASGSASCRKPEIRNSPPCINLI